MKDAVRQVTSGMIEMRRHLHTYPELSGEEHATALFVAKRLQEIGITPSLTLEGTAVTAEIVGDARADSGEMRSLLLRADIDALPIFEADDGRPCRSQNTGVMHACGHDAHTAMLLGVAAILARNRARLRGRVLLVFQPAEERISGARAMLEAKIVTPGSFQGVLGLHVLSQLEVGTIGLRSGAVFASSDEFRIDVVGRGGHGGLPHFASDPIPVASSIVLQMQTLITRECSPLEPAVLSIGKIHGGETPNGIADRVVLEGSIRTFDPAVRSLLLSRLPDMAEGIAHASGQQATFLRGSECPSVLCDGAMVHLVRTVAERVGGIRVEGIGPLPVADDIAEFMNLAPGCYFMLGAGKIGEAKERPHHNPLFDIDEGCLAIGAEVLTASAIEFFSDAGRPWSHDQAWVAQPQDLKRIDRK